MSKSKHVAGWLLKRPPFAVQVEAMRRADDDCRDRYGFWMEQGLGKTGSDYNSYLRALHADKVDAHVVVAPNYLLSGWEDEAREWGIETPIVTWPDRVPPKITCQPHTFIINHEALLYNGGKYLEELLDERRYLLAIDESSAFKKYNGAWTKRMMALVQRAAMVRELTGTPMSHNVMDLWSQLRMIGALHGVNPFVFRNRFAVMGGYMGKVVTGIKNEDELHRIINEVAFRALKSDWWDDMPEKLYPPPLRFEMSKRQSDAYRTMMDDFYVQVRDDDAIFADQVTHMQMKLQQIARGFVIDKEGDRIIELVEPKNNPAVKVTRQFIENASGKVLVFAFHEYSCRVLFEQLRDMGCVVLRGGLTKDEIASRKRRFNEDRAIKVCVGQTMVTMRGHTLLGTEDARCHTSMFYENIYALEPRKQLEDRNHRWGQDHAVLYQDISCSKQDDRIIAALQHRQEIVRAVVDAVRSTR